MLNLRGGKKKKQAATKCKSIIHELYSYLKLQGIYDLCISSYILSASPLVLLEALGFRITKTEWKC